MGVRFAREYPEILDELKHAVGQIQEIYEMVGMSEAQWREMSDSIRESCVKTLADDLFYGLGAESRIEVGKGYVQHDTQKHVIVVYDGGNTTHIVKLV